MKIRLERKEKPFVLEATNETGNSILLDASPEIGGRNAGTRPMELLIMGLAGCTSIDVLMILGKQKVDLKDYQVEIDASREKVGQASLFKEIHIKFKMFGEVTEEQAKNAINLSLEKYCSVAKTLEKTATITYELTIQND
ncbi:redox protein, regulator of disulfide bond formation [Leptospira ryugenii]|uniref:Redox protein, regulator of disulfide bond formation n=1 Tax=Leptospira ryugenii TaxID=1917863 RepID=A0A2P2E570_9LEPT|nr:OsmC family protein [Leptospira ryugenii]GBF52017.1 redox protein, regulator of disulfide bond formation [Leptospira ryugenii]